MTGEDPREQASPVVVTRDAKGRMIHLEFATDEAFVAWSTLFEQLHKESLIPGTRVVQFGIVVGEEHEVAMGAEDDHPPALVMVDPDVEPDVPR